MFLNRGQLLLALKTLAKYHACNYCVIGENTFKNIISGPVNYRDFRETAPLIVVFVNYSIIKPTLSTFGHLRYREEREVLIFSTNTSKKANLCPNLCRERMAKK